jgi:hypothetical protein
LVSQDAQLHAAVCSKVHSKKISGACSDRAELAKGSTPELLRTPRNASSGSALVWIFVRNKRGAKEGRNRFQLNGKMLSLTLVHLNGACRLAVYMSKSDTKCISRLTFFLSSKIDADQMKITNYFPLHHDFYSTFLRP